MKKIVVLLAILMIFSVNSIARTLDKFNVADSDYVMIINGEKLKKAEYEIKKKRFLSRQLVGDYDVSQKALNKALMDKILLEKLLLNFAKKSNITVTKKEIDEVFNKDTSKKLMQYFKLKPKEYKESIKKDIIFKKAEKLITSSITISEKDLWKAYNKYYKRISISFMKFSPKEANIDLTENEIKSYLESNEDIIKSFFDTNISRFKHLEEVEASHILVRSSKEEDDSLTLKRTNEIREKLLKGAKFSDIARKYSEGPTKTKGGYLGYFPRGRMVKSFEKEAFRLKINEISQAIKTRWGYHLIIVTNKKAASLDKFEDVKYSISKEFLKKEKKRIFMESMNKTLQKTIKNIKTIKELSKLMPKYKIYVKNNIQVNSSYYYIQGLGMATVIIKDLFKEDIKIGQIIKKVYKLGELLVVLQINKDIKNKKDFEMKKEDLKATILRELKNKFLDDWLKKEQKRAKVIINPDYLDF